MLESVDESFDHVAELVGFAIMTASAAIAMRWEDWLIAGRANFLAQRVAVVSLPGNYMAGLEAFQQDFGAGHVVSFLFAQMQLDRLALVSDRYLDLGAEAPAGTSQSSGVLPPFLAGRMLVGSNNRRVEQWIRYFRVAPARFEHPCAFAPSLESLLDRLPWPDSFGQVLPRSAGPCNPEHGIHESLTLLVLLRGSSALPGKSGSIAVPCSGEISCRCVLMLSHEPNDAELVAPKPKTARGKRSHKLICFTRP